MTLGDYHAMITAELEPLLLKYAVDLYGAGHNHMYLRNLQLPCV
jgi:hypothetical protein